MAAWYVGLILPTYLQYATPPIEADAIVHFIGAGTDVREKLVDELAAKGWGKYVIVPFDGKVFKAKDLKKPLEPEETGKIGRAVKLNHPQSYVERTQIEMLQTLALMEHFGLTSANFVSSPYHMRRIKLMADRVFDPTKYQIAFVPTPYEPPHHPWYLHAKDLKWVFSEWGKITWYLLYRPFLGSTL